MKGIPEEIKVILHRSVWLYLAVILVFAWSIDDRQATKERRRYLLGIFYNEELKNFKDGIIYFDYLIHQKPQEALNYFFLGYCYMQLDDDVRATRYFAQALKKDPNNATYQQYAAYANAKMMNKAGDIPAPRGDLQIPIE